MISGRRRLLEEDYRRGAELGEGRGVRVVEGYSKQVCTRDWIFGNALIFLFSAILRDLCASAVKSCLRKAGSCEEWHRIGGAGHEVFVEDFGGGGVAFGKDFLAEGEAGHGIEYAFFLEASEGVGIKHLGPLVGVVTGGVAGRGAEQVAEAVNHGRGLGFHRGAVGDEDFAIHFVEITA